MTIKLGVVMDPIGSINYNKDSTLAMLWEAQKRGWQLFYFEQKQLFMLNGKAFGDAITLEVSQDPKGFYKLHEQKRISLSELDVILMRKDPPFNEDYIYTTYILEHAQNSGVLVVNHPQSLRDANEKLFTAYFPQCSPPTLVSKSVQHMEAFWQEYEDIICKPLNTMGGVSIFRLKKNEVNANVIFETLTQHGSNFIMLQKFIPDIIHGDKRILLIDGEPVPHVLNRVPQGADWRGNLAVGAKAKIQALSARDKWICDELSPTLKKRGLYFVGIDVIGDYLTEINVTSPTGIRQIDEATDLNVSGLLMDCIERKL